MNIIGRNTLVACAMLFASFSNLQQAHALMIEVIPSDSAVLLSNTVSVDVFASGLGDGIAPSIGSYQIWFNFDDTILSYDSIVFGSGLDIFFGSFQDTILSPGLVDVFEVSFDDAADLDTFQPDRFILFTLNFTGIKIGTSSLIADVLSIADASGQNDLIPRSIENSQVTVRSNGVSVPEPSALILALLGLLLVGGRAHSHKPKT